MRGSTDDFEVRRRAHALGSSKSASFRALKTRNHEEKGGETPRHAALIIKMLAEFRKSYVKLKLEISL